jgi:hypothetical protein
MTKTNPVTARGMSGYLAGRIHSQVWMVHGSRCGRPTIAWLLA